MLREYPAYAAWWERKFGHSGLRRCRAVGSGPPSTSAGPAWHDGLEEGPEEASRRIGKNHNDALVGEVLESIRAAPPAFLESLVKDLVDTIEYGHGTLTGGPGDGGIDGVIRRDEFGLGLVYFQVKRCQEDGAYGDIDTIAP